MSQFISSHSPTVRIPRPRVRVGRSTPKEKGAEIHLQKNGDAVESIKVICSCGEEITIKCVYPDTSV